MHDAPPYPEVEVHATGVAVIELPSEPQFACFQRDAIGVIARTRLQPSLPGRPPRTVEVRYVMTSQEYDAQTPQQRLNRAREFVKLGIHNRIATMT